MKYNNLTVIDECELKYPCGVKYKAFKCICDCGKITTASKYKIINGITKSCGCIQNNSRKEFGKRIRLKNGESSLNQVYMVYKKTAKKRNHEFLLSKEEFQEIATKPCIYCGDSLTNELNRKDGYGSFKYTGIDRYDNNLGYIKSNCVPCCSVCNRIKTDMDIEFMYKHINMMIENSNLWKSKVN